MPNERNLLLTKIWWRTTQQFHQIYSFRKYSEAVSEPVRLAIEKDNSELLTSMIKEERFNKFFLDKDLFVKTIGNISDFSEQVSKKQAQVFKGYIDSLSMILAHSAIDSASYDYLCVVEQSASLNELEKFIDEKNVTIASVKESGFEGIVKIKFKEFMENIERQSLIKKIDYLFSFCSPSSSFIGIKNYTYDKKEIEAIDTLRHSIVHGDGCNVDMMNCTEKIQYLEKTSNYLMTMVATKYKLHIDAEQIGNFMTNKR